MKQTTKKIVRSSQVRMRRGGGSTTVAKSRRRSCAVGWDGCYYRCCCAGDALTAAIFYSTFRAPAVPSRMEDNAELSLTISQIVQRLKGSHLHSQIERQAKVS